MFFYASKILGILTVPSNFLLLVGLAGAVLAVTRHARLGRGLMAGSLVLLAVCGFSPLGTLLLGHLESRFPACELPERVTGVVVLGGMIDPERSLRRGQPILNDAAERLTYLAALHRRYPDAAIVFTGGSGGLAGGLPEAEAALPVLLSFGIPRERIVLESASRTTAENAVFTRRLVEPKADETPDETWLLVTSAAHMPRAVGAFRQAGFAVLPCPVDWRTDGGRMNYEPSWSVAGGLTRVDLASHEWRGLIAYRLSGRTGALFPAPE
ncbi:MAG TPA: YdcF family protein [Xanthobacteraceae bacterium]|nr:YdcF family protein [Xanthobacteraceae bacterium]